MNKITKVAVKNSGKTYVEPIPTSHDAIRKKNKIKSKPKSERGFIDSSGKFLDREDAAKVALKARQVKGVAEVKSKGLHSHNVKKK